MGERLLNRAWLQSAATQDVMAALDQAGIAFRFVGGVVRDGLLGGPVADIDIATPALPDAVVRAVRSAGLKAVPTGIEHGTVTAVARGQPFEITTLRRDVETDGRHAVVAFTDDWREDAARRDFTMNALYADRDGAVTDYFGGVDDLKAGRVRFIGDPEERIREDALRILRFFRFHAWYGKGALDADGSAACASMARMLGRLSGERMRVEMFKTLSAPDPARVWRAMMDAGVMAQVLLAASRTDALSRMIALEGELHLPAEPLRRLAALTGVLSDTAVAAISGRLKLSNRDSDHLRSLDGLADRVSLVSRGSFGQALYGAEPARVRDAAMLSHVDTGLPDTSILAEFCRFVAAWTEPRFPLTGADLQSVGVSPGPEMGRLLKVVEDWWVAADFVPDRAACLARIGEIKRFQTR